MSLRGILNQPLRWAAPLLSVVYLFACEGRPQPAALHASVAASPIQNNLSDELLQQYLRLAASANPTDHKTLMEALSSQEFIFRLDPREDHRRKAVTTLRLARLYQAMMKNDAPAMRDTLITLARLNKPGACDACDQLLIHALTIVRPAPREVIQFWHLHSDPDSIQLGFVMDALCENGTAPAVTLLEKRLTDAKYPSEQKINWMRRALLQHRRGIALLTGVDRWLNTTLPKTLRPALVEAIFDYRPEEWYRERNPPTPDAQPMTAEAKTLLRKIGTTALKKVVLNANQRRAVMQTLAELK